VLEEWPDAELIWIYGVVQRVPGNFDGQLLVSRLADAWNDQGFRGLLVQAGAPDVPAADPTTVRKVSAPAERLAEIQPLLERDADPRFFAYHPDTLFPVSLSQTEKREEAHLTGDSIEAESAPHRRDLKGLTAYQPEDHDILFGREAEILRVLSGLEELAARTSSDVTKVPLLVLTGRSGEGKSSLLRAGLIGRLRNHQYAALVSSGHCWPTRRT
jgi:hypothetical protein